MIFNNKILLVFIFIKEDNMKINTFLTNQRVTLQKSGLPPENEDFKDELKIQSHNSSELKEPDRKFLENIKTSSIQKELEEKTRESGKSFVLSALSSIAGAVGRIIGKVIDPIIYNAKCYGQLFKNYIGTKEGQLDEWLGEGIDKIEDLSAKYLKGVDRTGEIKRKYDGYDSSRDIFALYAKEGKPEDEYYNFQIEMAHIREGAEDEMLDTYICIDWDQDGGIDRPPFGLNNSQMERWKMAVKIGDPSDSAIIDYEGNSYEEDYENSFIDYKYSTVKFRLDKEALYRMGWKDGMPLNLQVMTAKGGETEIADEIRAKTDRKSVV